MRTIYDEDYYSTGFVQPTLETFKDHVKMRTTLFILSLATGVYLLRALGISKGFSNFFADKAALQSGTGMYMSPGPTQQKYDAAHFCNCSFLHKLALTNTKLSPVPSGLVAMAEELARLTSATSMEFKGANVSADKVIDTVQTSCKNQLLLHIEGNPGQSVDAFASAAVDHYLTEVRKQLTSKDVKGKVEKAKIYAAAIEAITEQIKEVSSVKRSIAEELQHRLK
jgi:hypothetical protein